MTKCLDSAKLATAIEEAVNGSVCQDSSDELLLEIDKLLEVLWFLKTEETLDFQLLNSITAVDYVESFQLVYHLTSLRHNQCTVVKANIYDRLNPTAPSAISIWRGADYQEREVYDLMGIKFDNHPNLKRLLLWEGFEGHPLRRDYLEPPLPYSWPQGG